MTSDNWQRAKDIFNSALDLDVRERQEYLSVACDGDAVLRQKVEDLLSSYESDFMEGQPVTRAEGKHDRLPTGTILGRYEIIRLLGAGGMGEVYLARDKSLNRNVCLKVLSLAASDTRRLIDRFVREAQSASALNHAHICTIYEIDRDHDPPYIAMEYIDGETLAEAIIKRNLDAKHAVSIALQIADGIAEAHDAGILHRDIKPANIILTKRGGVKIVDFGLAKRITADLEVKTQEQLSVSGTIMGTVSYMSPEQVKGEKVDTRSDIFSFGVLLYEMFAGRRPFDGNSTAETMALILTANPARWSSNSTSQLETLINRCLEKDKAQRFQLMKEVIAALQEIAPNNLDRSFIPDQESATVKLPPAQTGQGTARSLYLRGKVKAASENREKANGATVWFENTVGLASSFVQACVSHRNITAAMVGVLIAGLAIAGWLIFGRPPVSRIDSLAVMPFLNQTGDPDSDYLSDGMTETLIGRLSQIPDLSVMARSTVFRYKGRDISAKDIGKDLKVPAVLTGRVSRRGDQYNLYVELIDADSEKLIWYAEYNRPGSSLATIPGEIARDVANNLKQKLSHADEQRITRNYTENSAAYELYLKGRYYWDKRDEESYRVADDAYKQAIAIDPNYALAYAGLADLNLFRDEDRQVAMPLAKQYALRALDIDESLAEAHNTLAFVNENYDFDMPAAEAGFKRAIELKPTYAVAHQFYAGFLMQTGHPEAALAEARRAIELEPYSAAMNWFLGMQLGYARLYAEAIAQQQKTLQIQPDYGLAEVSLTDLYVQAGRYDDALALIHKGLRAEEPDDRSLLAIVNLRTGHESDARKILNEMIDRCKTPCGNTAYGIAKVYSALDEKDKAVRWLNIGYDRRIFNMFFIRVDPFFDGLHGDPRYEELIRRIGLQS